MTGRENPGSNHPARLTYDERTGALQQAFLDCFAKVGNISEAATLAGIHWTTAYDWRKADVLGFHDRFLLAREHYADYLESLARKRVEEPTNHGRTGSDVLLIAQLNAKRPQEYRPNVTVTHDLGARVLATLAQLQAKDRANGLGWGASPPQLAPGVTEQAPATEPVAPGQQEPPQDTSTS